MSRQEPTVSGLFQRFLEKVADAIDSEEDEPESLPESTGEEELLPVIDLTGREQMHPTEPLLFGEDEATAALVEGIVRGLCRRRGHHVLLVGEAGVGKSLLMADVARRAVQGKLSTLAERRILQVDLDPVSVEECFAQLSAIFVALGESPESVVVLNGLGAVLGSPQRQQLRELLLAQLQRVAARFVLFLTPREVRESFSGLAERSERFTEILVEEPSEESTRSILRQLASGLEAKFDLRIEDEAIHRAVALSSRYILNDQLPAKAFKLLRRLCEDIGFDRLHLASRQVSVGGEDVVRIVSQVSGVPVETLQGIGDRCDYEEALKETIVGQDHVVGEVAAELSLIKAGLTEPGKPASVLLFLGQTGTGKTEMAKALARLYSTSKQLKIYTLGNCVEQHSVATIIGVPPGYVGHDDGGALINDLNADPYGVFLLDEADKAHPDVLQPFLNLFDEGWVTDQRGVRAYADKAVIVLTSNVGQRMIAEMFQQGKGIDEITGRMKEALSQIRHSKSDRPVFTPEFLARIQRILVFGPLDAHAMEGIARKQIQAMQRDWSTRRGKRLEIADDVSARIGRRAHDLNEKAKGKEGGRIVRKLLSECVERPLQRAISLQPEDYKSCEALSVRLVESEGESPEVAVEFLGLAVAEAG